MHIENWAVDLGWDAIARFGQEPSYALPRAFFDDFITVRHAALRCAVLCHAMPWCAMSCCAMLPIGMARRAAALRCSQCCEKRQSTVCTGHGLLLRMGG